MNTTPEPRIASGNTASVQNVDPMAPLIQSFRYRPEVDGLRAVAVLAVVLFHAGLGFPGGYIGVDVFFVISGYLITSLIVNDLQQGRFTIVNFWERRARRIIPALAAVVLATLIAGWFLLLPRDYAALGKSAAWQSLFAANIYFWKATVSGYFLGAADEMPLLHTWSLAVEEQFYLIVPLVLTALFRYPGLRTRRVLAALFGVGILVSLCASIYYVAYHRSLAFYFLPSRAWELLLGATLAILPAAWMIHQRPVREIVSYAGLAGILVPCLLYTGQTPFPGLAALPPCLGTALVVWGNGRVEQGIPPSSLGRLLATRPVVFIGLISYSLYLWHWPILAFSKYYLAGEPLAPGNRIALVALAFVLAILSWRFIETPFRRKIRCARRKSVFTFAATALGASVTLGAAIFVLHGLPQRLPKTLRTALSANPEDDFLFAKQMTTDDIVAGNPIPIGVRDSDQPVSVIVWGDSHAMAALPAFDAVLKTKGLFGQAVVHSSTAPVLGYFAVEEYGLGKDSPLFNEEVISYIEKRRIPNVVLVGFWTAYPSNSTGSLQVALLTTVKRLVLAGSQPWVFLDVPNQPLDAGVFLRHRRATLPDLNQRRFCAKPGTDGIPGGEPAFLDQLTKAGARIIDPRPAFLDKSLDRYQNVIDGVILFRDGQHLTKLGAEKVLIPVLEKSFLPFLARPGTNKMATLVSGE
jgi:peptidoglycan/LPS O-acetylase OafA/YrhL